MVRNTRNRRYTHSQPSQGTVFESSEDTGLDGIGGAVMDFGGENSNDHGAFESQNDNNNGSPAMLDDHSNHSSPLGYRMDGYQITQWNGPDDEELRGEWFEDHIAVPFENLTASNHNNNNIQSSDSENSNNRKMPAMTQGTAAATDALLSLFHAPLEESPPKVAAAAAAVVAIPEEPPAMVPNRNVDSSSPSMEQLTQLFEKYLSQRDDPPVAATAQGQRNASPEDAPPEPDLAKAIFDSLMEHGLENLDKEEKKFVENVKRGGNNTAYINKCKSRVKKFFDTLKEFGGENLNRLCIKVPSHYSKGTSEDFVFYNILGGEKDEVKRYILNQCFILCAMKWEVTRGENKGKPYQPSTFDKYMQLISYDFKAKGIQYNYRHDFNNAGEFHGVLKDLWAKQQKKDPTFGTCPNRARAPQDILEIIVDAIRVGTLKPYEDPHHCQMTIILINGCCVGLRGQTEHSDLKMEQITVGTFPMTEVEDLAGKDFVGIRVPHHKTNQLGLGNTVIPRDKDLLIPILSDTEHDCFNAAGIVCWYLDHCHPDATKFYARRATKNEREKWTKEFGKDIWYCPSGTLKTNGQEDCNKNLGKNMVTVLIRDLGRLVGLTEDELMTLTGHALRATCITEMLAAGVTGADVAKHVRQSNINSVKPYMRPHGQCLANRLKALQPRKNVTLEKPEPEPVKKRIVNPYVRSNRGPAPVHTKTKKQRIDNVSTEKEEQVSVMSDLDSNEREELHRLRAEKAEQEVQRLRQQLEQQQGHNTAPPVPTYHHYHAPPPPQFGHGHYPSYGPPPPPPPNYYGHYGAYGSVHPYHPPQYNHGGYNMGGYDMYGGYGHGPPPQNNGYNHGHHLPAPPPNDAYNHRRGGEGPSNPNPSNPNP